MTRETYGHAGLCLLPGWRAHPRPRVRLRGQRPDPRISSTSPARINFQTRGLFVPSLAPLSCPPPQPPCPILPLGMVNPPFQEAHPKQRRAGAEAEGARDPKPSRAEAEGEPKPKTKPKASPCRIRAEAVSQAWGYQHHGGRGHQTDLDSELSQATKRLALCVLLARAQSCRR